MPSPASTRRANTTWHPARQPGLRARDPCRLAHDLFRLPAIVASLPWPGHCHCPTIREPQTPCAPLKQPPTWDLPSGLPLTLVLCRFTCLDRRRPVMSGAGLFPVAMHTRFPWSGSIFVVHISAPRRLGDRVQSSASIADAHSTCTISSWARGRTLGHHNRWPDGPTAKERWTSTRRESH